MTKFATEPIDNEIDAYVNLQKNVMNDKRFRILLILKKNNSTWSELMNNLDMRNPKILHDQINLLTSSKLIKKNEEGFYCITKLGKSCIEVNLSIMNKLNFKNGMKNEP